MQGTSTILTCPRKITGSKDRGVSRNGGHVAALDVAETTRLLIDNASSLGRGSGGCVTSWPQRN